MGTQTNGNGNGGHEILIENAGAIERVRIQLPKDGGVALLLGANGTGKSTGLNVIECAADKNHHHRLTPRDNTSRGSAEVLGVSLGIGKRMSRSGEMIVETIEGKFDVSDLVDGGGVETPEAADRERIKALLQLTGVTGADPSLFYRLVGGQEEFERLCPAKTTSTNDVVTMASRIKRDLEAESRRLKEAADREHIRAEGERSAVKDIDVNAEDDALRLQEELTLMIADREALKAKREAAIKATADREEAQRSLTEAQRTQAQTLSVAAAQAAAELTAKALAHADTDLQQVKSASQMAYEEAARIVATAEAALNKAKLDQASLKLNRDGLDQAAERTHALAKSSHESAVAAIESARQHETTLNQWQLTLQDNTPLELVTDEQLAEAELDVQLATRAVENGAIVRDAKARLGKAREYQEASAKLLTQSDKMRQAAHDTDVVLSELVARLPGCPLTVKDSRLVTTTDRGVELFAELSRGERYALVLKHIAVPAVGAGGMLVIRQRAWEGLDLANRRVIHECLKGTGVVAISAQCDAEVEPGELRSVIYEPPQLPAATV